jgi:hypothetical protein
MVAVMNRVEFKNGVAVWTQPETVTIPAPNPAKTTAAN